MVDIMKKGEQMLSWSLKMTKSFTPQEGEYKETCCKLGKYI
jgi:hypothetical protein